MALSWHEENPKNNLPLIPILMLYRHKALQYGIGQNDMLCLSRGIVPLQH